MRNDLRVIKTERAIRSAFVSLLGEKPFEKVNVTDVLKLALINRKTFYSHYVDKYDLAEKMTDELYGKFSAFLEEQASDREMFPREFFDFLRSRKDQILVLWKLPVPQGSVHDRVRALLAEKYIELARRNGISGDLPFQANLYAAVRLETLQYVMDSEGDIDPERLLSEIGTMYRFLKEQMHIEEVLRE